MKLLYNINNDKNYISINDIFRFDFNSHDLILPKVEEFISFDKNDFQSIALEVLTKYYTDVFSIIEMQEIISEAFNFNIPIYFLNDKVAMCELFHGPSKSFKDIAARFLAQIYKRKFSPNEKKLIIVATSGDTGSAIASAFHKSENINVIILFPKGKISEYQKHQMTCLKENIITIEVEHNFDTCQEYVKYYLQKYPQIIPANSINVNRIMAQMIIYFYLCNLFKDRKINFFIPTGNMGHVTSCLNVAMSAQNINKIILATNNNKTIKNFFDTGIYKKQISKETLASAMDVGDPNNFKRFAYLYKKISNKNLCTAYSNKDSEILNMIGKIYNDYSYIIDPHTATGLLSYEKFHEKANEHLNIIMATASPVKFANIVKKAINVDINDQNFDKKGKIKLEANYKIDNIKQLNTIIKNYI